MIQTSLNRVVDHIVYCVPDLDCAINWFEDLTGVRPQFGGYHKKQGTKNAIVGLGGRCYLELLAVDEANEDISESRWMGVDLISKSQVTRWALTSNELESDSRILSAFDDELGQISGGQRMTPENLKLQWEMVLPIDAPVVDLIPFMTNWEKSEVHPTDGLIPQVEFRSLQFVHPEPASIQKIFDQLRITSTVTQCIKPGIFLELNTPKGIVEL